MLSRPQRIFITLALLSCVGVGWYMLKGLPSSGAASPPPEQYRIEMILKARSNPPDFWRTVEMGAQAAAEEFAIDLTVTGPARESDVDRQIELVMGAISRKPDAIVLAAADYTRLAPVCGDIAAAGIKLILLDSDVDSDQKVCFVGTDNRELGRKMAEVVRNVTEPEERLGVIGHFQTSHTCMEREAGLLENLGDLSRLAGIEYCDSMVSIAKEQCKDMLRDNPDITCMVGLNESAALGICYALAEMGLARQVKVVACDSSLQQIQYMENGTIQAFVIQNPFNMGYLGLQAAVDAINGRTPSAVIDTGSIVVYREDINKKENQQLLFPFTDGH